MLSNKQKAMIKRAQREAQLSDAEYREVLETVSGARSSTDPRLGDRAFDRILAYMEAIYWRAVDAGRLQHVRKANAVFGLRGYWQGKNTREETSRDRYAASQVEAAIAHLEAQLTEMGYDERYLAGIRERVGTGADLATLHAYRTALDRTISFKRKHAEAAHA